MTGEKWAQAIVQLLVQQGVEMFYLAPGSRSTPLAMAVAANRQAQTCVHFDERGAAFAALGYGKGAGKPAALIATSGTAIGNLYPAVMEAHHSRTPLILLTADRPHELRDTGANQSCDQLKFFGDYVEWQVDLALPEEKLATHYLGTTIAQAVHMAKGAVQINCPFREPFFGHSEELPPLHTTHIESAEPQLSLEQAETWAKRLSHEKGVIVLGELPNGTPLEAIDALAERLGWPILAEVTSNGRTLKSSIPYYDSILKTQPSLRPTAVLHLGDRWISKTMNEWLNVAPYFLVAEHERRHDPFHRVTHRFVCNPNTFCKALLPHLASRTGWSSLWREHAAKISENLDLFFAENPALSELTLIRMIEKLPAEWALFLANSMPVRDANTLFFPGDQSAEVFCNRGLSGIDGNIATMVGIAQGANRPVLGLIGDQTTLHDLNSLALLKKSPHPVICLVVNNGGGGIFSYLPIAEKTEILETYFAAAHTLNFEKAAQMFDLPYTNPTSPQQLTDALAKPVSQLIEVTTTRTGSFALRGAMSRSLTSTPAGTLL
jgi:2-succinyl-5-enolpyruvyl-6-hydroxy-3-cyclohexene-1-carboxylate synthase